MELRDSKSKNNCCVPQCSATYIKNKTISLHKFPTYSKVLFQKWVVKLKIGKRVTQHMKVCSLHFRDEDFILKEHLNRRARLKKSAVPSMNLPLRKHDCVSRNESQISERRNRAKVREQKQLESILIPTESHNAVIECTENLPSTLQVDPEKKTAVANLIYFKENPVKFSKMYEDKAVQVNISEEYGTYNLDSLIDSNYKCSVITGIKSLIMINILVNYIENISGINKSYLTSKQKVILTLMRLKLDISFRSLGVLFKITPKTAQSYFHTTIKQLSYVLKQLIVFPSKEEVLHNMPKCFEQYRSTRLILDCTEIAIQKSKCLSCRIKTYSFYKGKHTIKYLIGVAPSGLITVVSKGYGGRVSDKAIFNAEQIIKKCDPGDSIMVDKGVLIEKECADHFIKLIQPPFLYKKKQFTKEDAKKTASIARARVHVERVIQRIKIFKICQGTLLWSMLPYMDDVLYVIAGLINLSNPVLASDKFIS